MLLNYFLEYIIKEQVISIYNYVTENQDYEFETFFWCSKTPSSGYMFLAIEGNNTNGNFFIEEAIFNGYTSIMSDNVFVVEEQARKYPSIIFLLIKNIHHTLNIMAKWGVGQFKGKKFVITGSAGKTTTTYMLSNVLKNFGTVICTDKYNTQYFLKRLCFSLYKRKGDFFVAELSSDRLGFIDLYGEIIKPHYSIITSIGGAHLCHFGSEENILLEKTSLFKHTSEGCFIPKRYEQSLRKVDMLKLNKNIHYVDNNFKIENKDVYFINNIRIHDSYLKGFHNFSNMNLIIHLIKYLGLDLNNNIEQTLSSLTCFPGRGNTITIEKKNHTNLVLICEHHNCSYGAFFSAVENIKKESLVIIGFLYELGPSTNEKITQIFQFMEENSSVKYIFLGDRKLLEIPHILNFSKVLPIHTDLIQFIEENNIENIFLKGSRGSKLEKYIEKIINSI